MWIFYHSVASGSGNTHYDQFVYDTSSLGLVLVCGGLAAIVAYNVIEHLYSDYKNN